MRLNELAARWLEEARTFESYDDGRGASVVKKCAAELQRCLVARGNEVLTIAQASAESGDSQDHLRSLVARGDIPQAGRKGSPRIRRRDLPIRPGRGSR